MISTYKLQKHAQKHALPGRLGHNFGLIRTGDTVAISADAFVDVFGTKTTTNSQRQKRQGRQKSIMINKSQ